jgi:LysM repeat protein
MNNSNPLVPQGSLMDQKSRGRARVKVAVFVVLAIHGIGLLALLMQGCNKPESENKPTTEVLPSQPSVPEETNSAALPSFADNTNLPSVDASLPGAASNTAPAFTSAPTSPPTMTSFDQTPAPPVTTSPFTPTPSASDYKVVKGDTFATIAKKLHVSTKALMDANPGVEPTRLKIGQTLQVPAAGATTTTAAPVGGAPAPETHGGTQTYTVKSGDTLARIASRNGVTVKALRSANNLRTDRIVVGQKLKLPAKASAPGTTAPSATSPSSALDTGAAPSSATPAGSLPPR